MKFARQQMMLALGLLCVLLLVTSSFARDAKDERVFDANFEKVWAACEQVASENYKLNQADKANGLLNFHRGASLIRNTWGVNVAAKVVSVNENQTKVTLFPEKLLKTELSSARSEVRNKFFAAVEHLLKP